MSATQAIEKSIPGREERMPAITPGFGSLQSFELMQRAARMLSSSTLVPAQYRAQKEIKDYGKVVGYEENPSAIPNCVIALNMSQRLGADVLMVMQNLYIVEGRPAWSAQFVAASINASGRFTPLRFELSEPGQTEAVTYDAVVWVNGTKQTKTKTINVTHRTCYAWALDKTTGDKITGPIVSMQMAIDEGWITKNGSKWQTMPEVMLHYRATSFFGKLHAPDLLMGLQTAEELQDVIETERDESGAFVPTDSETTASRPAPTKESRVKSATAAAKEKVVNDVQDAQPAEPEEPAPPADETVIDAEPVREQQAAEQTQAQEKPARTRPALNLE